MDNSNNTNQGEDQIEHKELAPGVVLYKEYKQLSKGDVVGLFIWKVQITTMSIVKFEVYLDQSENIELEALQNDNNNDSYVYSDELKTVNEILPFQVKEVARVVLKQGWKLKSKFKLTMNVPDKNLQYSYIEDDEKNIENHLNQFKNNYDNLPLELMTKEDIEVELSKEPINFIDIDFLPNDDSIVNPRYQENVKELFDYVIHWRRPEEFCMLDFNNCNLNNDDNNREIKIFNYQEVEPNDIHQGILPDNHLASCLSALAEKGNLIKRLFKSDQYSNYGVYQVKLCINGEWNTVTIDDYFPCIPKGNPLVSRSPGNELWVLILEKAIAKIYESYYALININIADFFLMLTGCPSFHLSLEDLVKNDGEEYCFKSIKTFVIEKKYLVVALSKNLDENIAIANNSNNQEIDENENDDMLTLSNYGYTILDIKDKHEENLIYLRKVWFDEKKEEKIKAYHSMVKETNPKLDINDAQLILTYNDFLKEFQSITVCYTKNWDEVRIRGKFVAVNELDNKIENIISKWYYSISVEKQTNVIISLHQDEDIIKDNDSKKQIMDISLSVLKQDNNLNEITHIESLDFTISSNAQVEINLPPGNYIILPRTTGCFFGRPFNKLTDDSIVDLFDYNTKTANPVFISTVKDIFKKFDMLLNRELRYSEFKGFWECITNNNITKEEFEENILNKYTSSNEGLTEKGFINFFIDNLISGGDKQIWNWLENLGYDQGLFPLRSRCFMLTFHSDNPLAVAVRDSLNTDLNNKVNKLILRTQGEERKSNTNSDITSIEYTSKSNVVSIGVLNRSNCTQKIMLDFSKAKDLLFSIKSGRVEKVIPPGHYDFFMHFYLLTDENGTNNNNLDYDMQVTPVQ